MSLAQSQKALHHALWSHEGLNALETKIDWEHFVSKHEAVMAPYAGYQMQLSLYQGLVQNTVQETLNSFFPYCRHLLADAWPELCERFRRQHPNRSYQLYRCAENFPSFIAEQEMWVDQYSFLPELALYEWLEVEIENAPNQIFPIDAVNLIPTTANILAQTAPIWNQASHLRLWFYNIPQLIEAIVADLEQDLIFDWPNTHAVTPKPTSLFIYRDTDTHRARFFELNALTAQFIELSQAEPKASYEAVFMALKDCHPTLASIPIDTLLSQGLPLLANCQAAKILLASRPI
jgi:hypothetical protein